MKILVTGGAGYIGSHAVRKLLEKNHELVVLDDLSNGHQESLPINVKFVKGDIGDASLLEKLFSDNKFDAVIHFAGFIEAGESMINPQKYFDNNVAKGLVLLNACVKHNVKKFIFSSSAGVYGNIKHLPIKEDENTVPANTYGETKLMFENFLKWYDKAYGLKFVVLRYFNAAGADSSSKIGEHHEPETHLIPIILSVALGKRKSISIFGTDYPTKDGTCVRDYVHVNDLADAHVLSLENLKDESKIYNVGTGQGFSVREIVEMCRKVTNHSIPAIESPRRLGDTPFLYADSSRIKKELNWKPKYGLKEIIETAWNWHKNNPKGYKK